MDSCHVTTKRGREVLRNLRFLTMSAPCTWALRQSTGNADHFPSPTNCKRVLNTRFRPCVPWADMVRTCATFSIGYAGYEPIRIPVMLSSPDWAAGLIRSTAGSFSDYVSVSLRRDIFLMAVRGNSETAFETDASSQLLHIRPPRYPV